ncbi:MAG: hypothetical protein AB7F86_05905 [Bdellovibrionales bacterium]
MKSFISKRNMFRGLLCGTAALATACSEVAFSPDPGYDGALEIPPGYQLESFGFNDQDTRAKVDVLFVIDNSGSMLEEQTKLAPALSSFITNIARIDWQIGITTTDTSNGPFGLKGSLVNLNGAGGKVLSAATPNYQQVFANTVIRNELIGCVDPNCPSSDERALEAATMAIGKRNSDNAGFFRQGADLALVILSDEDEQSTGTGTTPAQVVNAVTSAFGPNKTFTSFGIIIKPGDTACFASQSATSGQYGDYASALADLTKGVTGSICDSDYGPSLESIGTRVREQVKSITLKNMPNPDTIQIRIRPFDPNLTWTIEAQTLIFAYPPRSGTRIDVLYLPM